MRRGGGLCGGTHAASIQLLSVRGVKEYEGSRPLPAAMTPSGPIALSPWPPTRASATSPMRPEEQGGVGKRGSEGDERCEGMRGSEEDKGE